MNPLKYLAIRANEEPVRAVAAVQAVAAFVVIILAQYGVNIPEEVLASGVGAFSAFLAFVTRRQVTPVK